MSTEVIVWELPDCDLCRAAHKSSVAAFDAATRMGAWAYLCEDCFRTYGLGLGTGVGQRLILDPKAHDCT